MIDSQTAQDNRLSLFAHVFKSYMGIMPIVTAALAPLLTALNVIPVFEIQRKPLATIAGALGFLLIAWIFYVRRTIALGSITPGFRWIFNLLPLVLILGSVGCYVGYARLLESSLTSLAAGNPALSRLQTLNLSDQSIFIPNNVGLQLLYLGMFLCAEGAVVMMAIRDYCYHVRHVSEYDWMFGTQDGSVRADTGK